MTSRSDADVEELTVKAARVHRSLLKLRGRATSSNGDVSIEVSIDGRITKIVVSQWFSQTPPDAAATAIARTHSDALADAETAAAVVRRELTEDLTALAESAHFCSPKLLTRVAPPMRAGLPRSWWSLTTHQLFEGDPRPHAYMGRGHGDTRTAFPGDVDLGNRPPHRQKP